MVDVVSILLIGFLAYRNSLRAKLKDASPGLYAFLTVLLFFVGYIIGFFVVILFFCRDIINFSRIEDPKYKEEFSQQLTQAFINNPLHGLTTLLFGYGGYLLVRYMIECKPEKKKEIENLWPDKESA